MTTIAEHRKYADMAMAELEAIDGGTITREYEDGSVAISWTDAAWSAAAVPALEKVTSTPEGRAYFESFIDGWPGLNPALSSVLDTREGMKWLNDYLSGASA